MLKDKMPSGLQKITSIILTVIIASGAIVIASYALRGYMNKIFISPEVELDKTNSQDKPIGGEKDEHGCMLMAGYTWCEPKQKCLREWEEPCEQEEIFNLLSELKDETGINFSGIIKTELTWQTKTGDQEATGKGFDAVGITDEQYQSIEPFFKDKGFSVDLYNVLAGTISGATGYKKDDTVCIVTGAIVGSENAQGQWIALEPSQVDVEVKCGTFNQEQGRGGVGPFTSSVYSIADENLVLPNSDNWPVHQSNEYGYLFKYDSAEFSCEEDEWIGKCKKSNFTAENCKQPPADEEIDWEVIMENLVNCIGQCEIASGYFSCTPAQTQIGVYPNLSGLSLSDFCEKMHHGDDTCSKANYQIAGLPAIRYTTKAVPQEEHEIDGEMKKAPIEIQDYIYFSHGDKNYMIRNLTDLPDKKGRKAIESFLSTFKFE